MANELVNKINKCEKESGKSWSVKIFLKNGFWKCSGCIIFSVAYYKKGCRVFGRK